MAGPKRKFTTSLASDAVTFASDHPLISLAKSYSLANINYKNVWRGIVNIPPIHFYMEMIASSQLLTASDKKIIAL